MNWGAISPALGTLLGAGLGAAAAAPTGGLSLAALPAMAPSIAAGGAVGGALGTVGGAMAPKDMPPPPATQLPGTKPMMPNSMQQGGLAQELQKLQPGQGGFLKRPFIG